MEDRGQGMRINRKKEKKDKKAQENNELFKSL